MVEVLIDSVYYQALLLLTFHSLTRRRGILEKYLLNVVSGVDRPCASKGAFSMLCPADLANAAAVLFV